MQYQSNSLADWVGSDLKLLWVPPCVLEDKQDAEGKKSTNRCTDHRLAGKLDNFECMRVAFCRKLRLGQAVLDREAKCFRDPHLNSDVALKRDNRQWSSVPCRFPLPTRRWTLPLEICHRFAPTLTSTSSFWHCLRHSQQRTDRCHFDSEGHPHRLP